MFTKTEQADRVLRESLDGNKSPLQAGESEKKCSQGGRELQWGRGRRWYTHLATAHHNSGSLNGEKRGKGRCLNR